MKVRQFLLCAALVLAVGQAEAQTARRIRDEYSQVTSAAQTVSAFGADLFGESVNLKDGVTSFSAVDVSARTNSGLALAVGRTLGVNARDVDDYVNKTADGELFGNWKLDVPVIHGTYDERTGWIVSGSTPTLRCSSGSTPPAVASAYTNWNISYQPEQYWHGNEISIPGKGSHPLLVLPAAEPRPSDGQSYYWTTKDNWRVSCLPALKNGAGEGFKVALPDGTKYTFDWISSRKVAALKDKQCKTAFYNEYNVANWLYTYWEYLGDEPIEGPIGGPTGGPDALWRMHRMDGGGASGGSQQLNYCSEQVVVNRREYFLHATMVEDRFGNTVTYDYDPANPRRLRSLTSSDGNSIALSYGSHGKVAAVTHNGRTWQYQYTTADGAALSAVVQPDNSRWSFHYGDLYTMLHHDNQKILWADCEPSVPGQATAAVTIIHPAGATGVFNFRSMMHGTDRTPGGCYQPDPDKPLHAEVSSIVMVYKTASLTSKQITGPGLPQQTWSYTYFPNWSWNPNGYVDDCTGAICDSTVTTDVTAPDGTVTRSTFGNDYFRNAGQLLSVETLGSPGAGQRTSHTYTSSASGQPFPDRAGVDPNPRNNRLITEKNRPVVSTTTFRDGDSFSHTVDTFDSWVRPVRVTKSNSLGYSKQEITEYHDNLGLWVLGQVRRQYVPETSVNNIGNSASLVFAETEYNSQALPWKIYSFGKLQETLSYTPQGNLITAADGAGNTVTLSDHYRGLPRLIRFPATAEAPAGATVSALVDANGWITAVTNEVGAKTCYTHDVMGRVTSIVYPSETQVGVCDTSAWSPTSLSFQPVATDEFGLPGGHWRLSRYEGNRHTHTYFDAMWRPLLERSLDAADPSNTLTETIKRYDSMGRLSFVSYPQRGVASLFDVTQGTFTSYDPLGRAIRVEQSSDLNALVTTTEYLNGLRVRVINPRGQVSTTSHLAWDQPSYELPVASLMPEGKVIEIDRHPRFGWPLRLWQRSADYNQQQVRRYVYDGNALLCKTIEPETGATVIGYDAAGNLAWSASGLDLGSYGDTNGCNHSEAWGSGRRAIRTYDAHNRLTALQFPDARGSQSWTYTPDGLAASVTATNETGGAAPVTSSYTYNKRRLLAGESVSQAGWYTWTLGYTYDSLGSLAAESYPTGLSIQYAPNALGQATRAGEYATNARYFPNGAVQSFTYGNGVVHTLTQNSRQLPARVTSAGVIDFTYNYDANGNVTNIWDLTRGDNYSRWLTYDGLDRLTSAGSAAFGGDAWHRFTYDALDNLKSWKLTGVKDYGDYVYDPTTHRLSAIRNSAGATLKTFFYDSQGNLSAQNLQAYDFDFGNRLRSVPGKESYRYDGQGRRVQTLRADGTTSLWMYSLDGRMMFSWDGPSSQKTHEFVYLAGSLVATIDHNWPSNSVIALKYHHTDALGSPIVVTDGTGQVLERNDYEPFGALIGKPSFSGVGYTGHVMDGATGLTYMQQRYYDPNVGRFLSVDPLDADPSQGANFNRYWYASNNPYRFVDPDGRQSMDLGPLRRMANDPTCESPGACLQSWAVNQLKALFGGDIQREGSEGPNVVLGGGGALGSGVAVELKLNDGSGFVEWIPVGEGAEVYIALKAKEGVVIPWRAEPVDAPAGSLTGTISGGHIVHGGAHVEVNPGGTVKVKPKVGLGTGSLNSVTPRLRLWTWKPWWGNGNESVPAPPRPEDQPKAPPPPPSK